MPRLPRTAVVATTVAGIGLIGAGVVPAYGHVSPKGITINCEALGVDRNDGANAAGTSRQFCGLRNDGSTSTTGNARGGDAAVIDGLID